MVVFILEKFLWTYNHGVPSLVKWKPLSLEPWGSLHTTQKSFGPRSIGCLAFSKRKICNDKVKRKDTGSPMTLVPRQELLSREEKIYVHKDIGC